MRCYPLISVVIHPALLVAFTIQFTSCATPAAMSSSNGGTYSALCKENGQVATKEVTAVDCQFFNASSQITTFEVSKVQMPEGYQGKVATASDIEHLKADQDDSANKKTLLSMLMVGTIAIGGRGSSQVGVGAVPVINSISTPALPSTAASNSQPSPPFGGPFKVDLSKQEKRTTLLMLGESGSLPEYLDLCFSQPTTECLRTPIEPWAGRSRLRAR